MSRTVRPASRRKFLGMGQERLQVFFKIIEDGCPPSWTKSLESQAAPTDYPVEHAVLETKDRRND